MLLSIMQRVTPEKAQDTLLTVASAGALIIGRRAAAIGLFAQAAKSLESKWRAQHPEYQGGAIERWKMAIDHYEVTHQNKTNRVLHMVGIPIIVAGTAGLMVSPILTPMWAAALGAFTVGWGMNLAGHYMFEKNAPAFADDPLSFIAGPVWDFTQIKNLFMPQPA